MISTDGTERLSVLAVEGAAIGKRTNDVDRQNAGSKQNRAIHSSKISVVLRKWERTSQRLMHESM